jgi:hypothetical protein
LITEGKVLDASFSFYVRALALKSQVPFSFQDRARNLKFHSVILRVGVLPLSVILSAKEYVTIAILKD